MKWLAAMALVLSPLAAAQAEAGAPWQLERSGVRNVEAPDGHVYRLMIAWPEGDPPAEGWPVLWVLDGEDHFATAVLTARRLARAAPRSGVEPGLVVGVDSGPLARRVRDYSPDIPGYRIPQGLPAHGLETGGADSFLDLIDQRLRPMVEDGWPVDPHRQTLMGHSFGGLLGLHALQSRRNWSAIVSVSPSIWYGAGAAGRPSGQLAADRRLLVAMGSEEGGPDGQNAAEAEAVTARWREAGADARFLSLAGHGHGTTMLAAMGAAIRFAFGARR